MAVGCYQSLEIELRIKTPRTSESYWKPKLTLDENHLCEQNGAATIAARRNRLRQQPKLFSAKERLSDRGRTTPNQSLYGDNSEQQTHDWPWKRVFTLTAIFVQGFKSWIYWKVRKLYRIGHKNRIIIT